MRSFKQNPKDNARLLEKLQVNEEASIWHSLRKPTMQSMKHAMLFVVLAEPQPVNEGGYPSMPPFR